MSTYFILILLIKLSKKSSSYAKEQAGVVWKPREVSLVLSSLPQIEWLFPPAPEMVTSVTRTPTVTTLLFIWIFNMTFDSEVLSLEFFF